jgi:hypothetical protein
MRLEQLATRIALLESKVNFLMTGEFTPVSVDGINVETIDARLSVVETTVDMLVAQKTKEIMTSIASADASEGVTIGTEAIVALSPSATFPEASDIVSAVVESQVDLPAIDSEEASALVATAMTTIITAQPEVVTNSDLMVNTILDALTNQPSIVEGTDADQAIDAISVIITNITGEEVSEEVKLQIQNAIFSESDPLLDDIEARLDIVEAKYNTLVK